MSPKWFLYHQEVCTYTVTNVLSCCGYGILYHCTTPAPPTPTGVTAQFTSTSSVRVTWQWNSSGPAPNCFNTTTVTYRPKGGSESPLELSDPATTGATLTDLHCNTSYTITVVATAGVHRSERVMFLQPQGIHTERSVNVSKYAECVNPSIHCGHVMSITAGLRSLSAVVLSATSVHLTWVAPCDTQQYNIYYRGSCGAYVDEGRLNTSHQEYTVDGLQEDISYTFTVNQTGFSGRRVFPTGPVYARTFTAGT